jgi:hypothetical protein
MRTMDETMGKFLAFIITLIALGALLGIYVMLTKFVPFLVWLIWTAVKIMLLLVIGFIIYGWTEVLLNKD